MFYFNPYAIPPLAASILLFSLGIFVYFNNKYSVVNKTFALLNLCTVFWLFGYFIMYSTPNRNIALNCTKLVYSGVIFIPIVYYHFIISFLEIKNQALIVRINYLVGLILTILLFKSNLIVSGLHNYFWGLQTKKGHFHNYFLGLFFILFTRCFILLWKKKNDVLLTSPTQARRINYVFIAFAIAIISSTDFIPNYGFELYPLGFLFMSIFVIVTTYAIVRHQLMEIHVAVKKGVVYSTLVALITAFYLIFIMSIGRLFQDLAGYQSFLINLVAIFIIAMLLNPLRNKIQKFLDYRFFKGTLESFAAEQEKLKERLFNAEKLAYVGQLASSVVHEIRNPLTAIKTYVEYLPKKYNDPEFKDKFDRLVPKEIERISSVLHQLLDLAKPRTPELRQVYLHFVINSTLNLLENNLKNKKISVKKNYHNEDIIIQGDQEQLRQVFLNLFINAIDAVESRGTITVSTNLCLSAPKSALICVQDNGRGISEENLKKLFTPFFTTKKEGVGLGLIITQEIIENHGGKIKVESKMGEGTTFIVKVPID